MSFVPPDAFWRLARAEIRGPFVRETSGLCMTVRDDVWDEALETAAEQGKFTIEDLSLDEDERHIARETLRNMEEFGWLERDTPNSSIWMASDKVDSGLSESDEE